MVEHRRELLQAFLQQLMLGDQPMCPQYYGKMLAACYSRFFPASLTSSIRKNGVIVSVSRFKHMYLNFGVELDTNDLSIKICAVEFAIPAWAAAHLSIKTVPELPLPTISARSTWPTVANTSLDFAKLLHEEGLTQTAAAQ